MSERKECNGMLLSLAVPLSETVAYSFSNCEYMHKGISNSKIKHQQPVDIIHISCGRYGKHLSQLFVFGDQEHETYMCCVMWKLLPISQYLVVEIPLIFSISTQSAVSPQSQWLVEWVFTCRILLVLCRFSPSFLQKEK